MSNVSLNYKCSHITHLFFIQANNIDKLLLRNSVEQIYDDWMYSTSVNYCLTKY